MMVDRRTLWDRKNREAERAKGKVRRYLWVYPEDFPAVRAYAERLTEEREGEKGAGNQCVEHIDGDPTNNALDNLRLAPMPQKVKPAGDR